MHCANAGRAQPRRSTSPVACGATQELLKRKVQQRNHGCHSQAAFRCGNFQPCCMVCIHTSRSEVKLKREPLAMARGRDAYRHPICKDIRSIVGLLKRIEGSIAQLEPLLRSPAWCHESRFVSAREWRQLQKTFRCILPFLQHNRGRDPAISESANLAWAMTRRGQPLPAIDIY